MVMDLKYLNEFRDILIKNKKPVSRLEYTKNNYDNKGSLIKKELPTFTTDFCEIGIYKNEMYWVFIIESKTFNSKLFESLKDKLNVKIYGFLDFNKTLYPVKNFDYNKFIKTIQQDRYLQIQFDFKNTETISLFKEYEDIVEIFNKSKVKVINQLKVNLITKNK